MSRPFGLAFALLVVGPLALCPAALPAQLPAVPEVQFCILPEPYLQAGEQRLLALLANDADFIAKVTDRLYPAGQAPRRLPAQPECQEFATVLVARGRIGAQPTAIFALGSGYVVYQPGPGDTSGSFTLISPSLEVVGVSYYAGFRSRRSN